MPPKIALARAYDPINNDTRLGPADEVQISTLLSIKTGGCPEDCKYCPQSVRFDTALERESLMDVDAVLEAARSSSSTSGLRFCGMIDEPVVTAGASETSANSWV